MLKLERTGSNLSAFGKIYLTIGFVVGTSIFILFQLGIYMGGFLLIFKFLGIDVSLIEPAILTAVLFLYWGSKSREASINEKQNAKRRTLWAKEMDALCPNPKYGDEVYCPSDGITYVYMSFSPDWTMYDSSWGRK